MKLLTPVALAAALTLLVPLAVAEEDDAIAEIEGEGIERIAEGQEAQQVVTEITRESRVLLDEYQVQLKLVEGLQTYIELLDTQLGGQAEEINLLRTSINDVAVVERQILPLLLRMVDTLDAFIVRDIPFLPEEREQRVEKLRLLLGRSDVTVAEKSRRVFEAFQIETDYGRTIEGYTGKLALEGATYDAEFLRIGRLALLYKTVGSENVGRWDPNSRSWQALSNSPWQRMIRDGLSVARQEVAPQLIHIPLVPAEIANK